MRKKTRIESAVYERGYVYEFHFRLVWVTRYRQELFTSPDLVSEMEEILLKIAKLNEMSVESLSIHPSFVTLEFSFKPKMAPTNAVKALKGGSARLFLANHPELKSSSAWQGHIWSKSYYMTTIGVRDKEAVRIYVENECSK